MPDINKNTTMPQCVQTSVTSSPFRILNLYAGIGGNRKLWNDEKFEITAVEYDEEIAMIYKDLYPNDTVIVADAHEYLINNYMNFDFIWSSPPCQHLKWLLVVEVMELNNILILNYGKK